MSPRAKRSAFVAVSCLLAGSVWCWLTIRSAGVLVVPAGRTLTANTLRVRGTLVNRGRVIANTIEASGIINTGAIAARGRDLDIEGAQVVRNASGTIAAPGTIRVAANGLRLSGGAWLSRRLDLDAGAGTLTTNLGRVTGEVHSHAASAHVLARTPLLRLGTSAIAGDPLFANSSGSIEIEGPNSFSGAVALIARGDITSDSTGSLTTSSGGSVLLAAGTIVSSGSYSVVTNSPTTGASSFVVIQFYSAYGGNVDLSAFTGTGPVITAPGGSVTLVAYSNSTSNGRVLLPTAPTWAIDTSNTSGAGGNVTLVAGAPAGATQPVIEAGNIRTGGAPAGSIKLDTSEPTLNNSPSNEVAADGTSSATFTGTTPSITAGDAEISAGNLDAIGAGGVTGSGGAGGAIQLTAGGFIATHHLLAWGGGGAGGQPGGNGGSVSVTSSSGSVAIDGEVNASGGGGGGNNTGGSAGSVALSAPAGSISIVGSIYNAAGGPGGALPGGGGGGSYGGGGGGEGPGGGGGSGAAGGGGGNTGPGGGGGFGGGGAAGSGTGTVAGSATGDLSFGSIGAPGGANTGYNDSGGTDGGGGEPSGSAASSGATGAVDITVLTGELRLNSSNVPALSSMSVTDTLPPPVITSATTASGTYGSAFSYTITASNAPSSYSVTGTLPPGLSANGAQITGTATAAGTYDVTLGATSSYGTGTAMLAITIAPAALTITAAPASATMTYGGAAPAVAASYSGLVNGNSAPATAPTCITTASSASPAGSYPALCSGAADPNYAISYAAGTVTVDPAPLTMTANNATMTYHDTVPVLGYTASGFVNSDTASVLSAAPALQTNATSSSPPGSNYAVTFQACPTAGNYTVTCDPGTMTVTAAPGGAAHFSGVLVDAGGSLDPVGLAVDASGHVFIADASSGDVLEGSGFSTPTAVLTGLSFSAGTPAGLAMDGSGNLYIAETGTGALVKAAPSGGGTYTAQSIGTVSGIRGVAAAADGSLYTTGSGGTVEKWTPSGNTYASATIVSGLTAPSGIAVDATGDLFIAEPTLGTVVEENFSSGTYSSATVDSTLTSPGGLVMDAAGDLFAADSGGQEVVEEVPGNGYSRVVTASAVYNGVETPVAVAVDSSGNLFLGDDGAHSVLEWPAQGVTFGAIAAGSTSAALTLEFNFVASSTLGSTISTASDFGISSTSDTCSGKSFVLGNTCSVRVSFAATGAGTRPGAIELTDTSGNVLASALVTGSATAGEMAFSGTPALIGGTVTQPNQAVVDGSGDVFVADTAQGILEQKLSSGVYIETGLGSGVSAPEGIAVDGAGNIFVSDTGNGRVLEESPSGGAYVQSVVATGLNAPGAIAVDGGGSLYVATPSAVIRLRPLAGSYVQSTVATVTLPLGVGLAVNAQGVVFVADPGAKAILQATPNGGAYTTTLLATGVFGDAVGVALDAAGNLYVFDSSSNEISSLSAASRYTSATAMSAAAAPALAVDAEGNLFYEAMGSSRQLTRLNRAAAASLSFAASALGADSSDSPKTFNITNTGTAVLTISTVIAPSLSFTASGCASGSIAEGDSCSESISFAPRTLGANASSLTFTDDNLGMTNAQQTVGLSGTGSPAPLVITASSPAMTYGGSVPAISASYSGLVNGDLAPSTPPRCSTTATAASPVSSKPATTCSGASDANYAISYVAGRVSVGPAPLTITASSPAMIYGGAVPAIAPSYTGLVNGEATSTALTALPLCATSATSATPVGTTPATVCGAAVAPNYTVTYAPGVVTVTPAPLTVTASSPSMTYGGAVPAITPLYTGLVDNQTAPATPPVCTTMATSTSLPGSNPATRCSGAQDPNYAISYINGAVNVTAAGVLTITASSASMAYGGTPPAVTASYSGAASSVLTTLPTCTSTASSSLPAGSTATTACSGAAAPGYTIDYAPGVVTVTPAPLTVTASSASMAYGSTVPAITPVYSGFVNGDTAAALTSVPACIAEATSATSAGATATLCSGGAAANYTLTDVPGTLTITKAASTVALASGATSVGAGFGFALTATVAPATSGTPSGAVSFFDGTTALGTATLLNGKASFTAKLASLGTHDLTAQYAGDGNFTASSSAAVAVSVVASGYTLAATPDLIDVQRGSSGQILITTTPFGNFQGTVSFACSGLPSYASCTFTPASLTLDGSNTPQEMALTVTAAAGAGVPWRPEGGGGRWLWLLAILVAGLAALRLSRRREPLAIGMAGVCLLLAGCGGTAAGNGSGNNTTRTTTQSATVKVTASANASAGTASQTAAVTLTITFD